MNPSPPNFRLLVRWMLSGVLVGALLGAVAMAWVMRPSVKWESRLMGKEVVGPPAPIPLTGGGGPTGSGKVGVASGAGVVPVIVVADDLDESVKALLAIADPVVRQAALAQFLDTLPADRWPEFLASAKKWADRGGSQDDPASFMAGLGMLESVLSLMMQRSPEGLLSGLRETQNDGVAMAAFRFWANRDLPAAMAYFENNLRSLPPQKQAEAATGLARELVKKDPAAAFAWIKGLPMDMQAQVAHGAILTLSHVDPEAAQQLLVAEKELPGRDEFAEELAKGWASTKPEEALAWAKRLPDDLSARAVQGAMEQLAEKNFDAALQEVAALTPSQQDGALKALTGTLTMQDQSHLAGLTQLLERLPESQGRARAAKHTLLKWALHDPEAASTWVASQPDGLTRDAAIAGFGYTSVAAKRDPEAGLEWTAAMSDPAARRGMLGENIKAWAEFDPEAARAWIQSSPRLSNEEREQLLPMTR